MKKIKLWWSERAGHWHASWLPEGGLGAEGITISLHLIDAKDRNNSIEAIKMAQAEMARASLAQYCPPQSKQEFEVEELREYGLTSFRERNG